MHIGARGHCAVCGKRITPSFLLCRDCERLFGVAGVPFRDWPEALHELALEHARERRREAAWCERVVPWPENWDE